MRDDDSVNFEILQEYAHVTDVHLREERRAYCRVDPNGDVEDAISFTSDFPNIDLVSFAREPLDEYLAASGSVLVRLFDVPVPHADFPLDANGSYAITAIGLDFFHRPSVGPVLAVRRGCQLLRPRKPRQHIFATIRQRDEFQDQVRDFITTLDDRVPIEHFRFACFSPEVLTRYSGNIDKYTVQDGTIVCRHAWSLRYGVNEAGNVHVYVKSLRLLPSDELKHWRVYNIECRAGLSELTFARDIQGNWARREPAEEVADILRRWRDSCVPWWRVAEAALLDQVKTPLTDNRTEWADAFAILSRLIIEGFQIKTIRNGLAERKIPYDESSTKNLHLIETLLVGASILDAGKKLVGLRAVHEIRNKYSHARGRDALELAKQALREHYTYANHFQNICDVVAAELRLIERAFNWNLKQ